MKNRSLLVAALLSCTLSVAHAAELEKAVAAAGETVHASVASQKKLNPRPQPGHPGEQHPQPGQPHPQSHPQPAPHPHPQPQPHPQPRPEPRPQPRPEPGPRPGPHPQPRPEPRPQPRPGPRPPHAPEHRPDWHGHQGGWGERPHGHYGYHWDSWNRPLWLGWVIWSGVGSCRNWYWERQSLCHADCQAEFDACLASGADSALCANTNMNCNDSCDYEWNNTWSPYWNRCLP